MLQSKLFFETRKEVSKEEKSKNATLLIRAGFIDKLSSGVYSFLPLGFRVLKKIENIIRNEMQEIGGQELLMPALHPKENWQKTNRWETMDDLFKLKTDSQEFALGPTHEEVIVPLAKKFIQTYKDLPLYLFQIQTKFRDEPRPKAGILRAKEFLMKDLYSFHQDEKDLANYYEKVKKTYLKIFKNLKINVILTEASGGTFSKFSHEFQVPSKNGEDLILYCSKCHFSRNKEIASNLTKCPNCGSNLEKIKSIEVANIFQLKNKYSKPFNLIYKDKNGKEKEVLMGCYGIGISRILGTLAEIYHDDKGLIWPEIVSPYKYHLIFIQSSDSRINEKIIKSAEKIYNFLLKNNKEVVYDDRQISTGEKFMDADLIGAPYRIVVSEKTLKQNSLEIKKRNSKSLTLLKLDKCAKLLS